MILDIVLRIITTLSGVVVAIKAGYDLFHTKRK